MGKRPRLSPAGRAGDAGDWPFKRMYHTPKSNNQHTSTEVEYTYTFRLWKEPLHFHSVGYYGVIETPPVAVCFFMECRIR